MPHAVVRMADESKLPVSFSFRPQAPESLIFACSFVSTPCGGTKLMARTGVTKRRYWSVMQTRGSASGVSRFSLTVSCTVAEQVPKRSHMPSKEPSVLAAQHYTSHTRTIRRREVSCGSVKKNSRLSYRSSSRTDGKWFVYM